VAPDHLYVKPSTGVQAMIGQRLKAEVSVFWNVVGAKASVRMVLPTFSP